MANDSKIAPVRMCLRQMTGSKFIAIDLQVLVFKVAATSWKVSKAITVHLKFKLPFKYGGKTMESVVICCISTTVSL